MQKLGRGEGQENPDLRTKLRQFQELVTRLNSFYQKNLGNNKERDEALVHLLRLMNHVLESSSGGRFREDVLNDTLGNLSQEAEGYLSGTKEL